MEINAQTKLSDIIEAYPFMRSGMADINGKFRMLQTPVGKIMMGKATVADMSARSGMPLDELVSAIAEKTGATAVLPADGESAGGQASAAGGANPNGSSAQGEGQSHGEPSQGETTVEAQAPAAGEAPASESASVQIGRAHV